MRNWHEVFVKVGEVSFRRRIYPRDCYSCGQPMTELADSVILKCHDCDIWETGTTTGRFHYARQESFDWDGDLIPFADHGALDYPSPDCWGIPRE